MNNLKIDNGEATRFTGGGMKLPTPPKRGEIMYCQVCGEKMLPKDFSKNETLRKREFKWQIHSECFMQMDSLADQAVPGLLSERKQREERR